MFKDILKMLKDMDITYVALAEESDPTNVKGVVFGTPEFITKFLSVAKDIDTDYMDDMDIEDKKYLN